MMPLKPLRRRIRPASSLQVWAASARRSASPLEPAERRRIALLDVLGAVEADSGRPRRASRAEQEHLGHGEAGRLLVDVEDVDLDRERSARQIGPRVVDEAVRVTTPRAGTRRPTARSGASSATTLPPSFHAADETRSRSTPRRRSSTSRRRHAHTTPEW